MTSTPSYSMPVNIVKGTYPELITFIILNMWPSHFGLPLLLAIVIFSKQVQRHPTFINLCITFIFVGVSSSLLVYTGHVQGPEPPKMLCLFQASLLYGVPAFASTAVFVLVLQMFLVIRSTFKGQEGPKTGNTVRLWAMIIAPYAAWLTCIIATAWDGSLNPERVSRDRRFFYCSLDSLPLTDTLTITAAIILIATIILEVWTVVLFYRRWKYGRQGRQVTVTDLNMPIRILAFGLYLTMALSLSLLSVTSPQSPVPDLAIATAASVVILIFGTQPDILRALCFWRKRKMDPLPGSSMLSDEKSSWSERS